MIMCCSEWLCSTWQQCDTGDPNLLQAAAGSSHCTGTLYCVAAAGAAYRPPVVVHSSSSIMHSNTVEMLSPAPEINSCNFTCWHPAVTGFSSLIYSSLSPSAAERWRPAGGNIQCVSVLNPFTCSTPRRVLRNDWSGSRTTQHLISEVYKVLRDDSYNVLKKSVPRSLILSFSHFLIHSFPHPLFLPIINKQELTLSTELNGRQ